MHCTSYLSWKKKSKNNFDFSLPLKKDATASWLVLGRVHLIQTFDTLARVD